MKSLSLFFVVLTCTVCSAELVTLAFDTGMGETIIFRASPEVVILSKGGQSDRLRKHIDDGAYLKIHEAVQAFAEERGLSLSGIEEAKSKFHNILMIKMGADAFVYSMTGTMDDIVILIDEFKEHLGDEGVNRFINKYLVEPSASGNADKPPA